MRVLLDVAFTVLSTVLRFERHPIKFYITDICSDFSVNLCHGISKMN